jgi:CheY-like chemotaxis protein
VLIAESYEGVRQSCSRYLDRFHFQVVEAAHGEQAIARIAAEPPQLILTELNLPSMPAGRLKQWLSQSWRTRQIPIIVLADNLDGAAAEELRHHMAGVLMKPFPLGRMLDEIRRTLRISVAEGSGASSA